MIHYIKKTIEFLRDLPSNIISWLGSTYEWLAEAFTNWDSELHNFKEELVKVIGQTGTALRIVIVKLKEILRDLGEIIKEFRQGFGGWGF